MARGAVPLIRALPVWGAAGLVLAVTVGTLIAVAARADVTEGLSNADWAAVRFTVTQAVLSAIFSVLPAIPVARALARRTFRGRALVVSLLGAPFLFPVIVAILGLLAVFGQNGVINAGLEALGLPKLSIYGLQGVVLAHVFFNLPLATRLILQGWLSVPAERYRLAASLNVPVWRVIEAPMLVRVVPGALLVIFLICLTSFAVALTLGGGPRATTVELAIYQAIRFEFDLGRAAILACLQFLLCAAAALAVWWLTPLQGLGGGLDRAVQRWDRASLADWVWIAGVMVFLLVPSALVLSRGLPELMALPGSVWAAAGRSIVVAACATVLCLTLAIPLGLRGGLLAGLTGALPLAASALVVGTGAFLILYPLVNPVSVALPVTVLGNAVFALPFALRVLVPAAQDVQEHYGRLADSLNLTGWARLRIVILPRLRRPLGFAAGLTAALSMGDLGIIALFAGEAQETLPLAVYRLMGAYRMDAAAGAGLLLVVLSLGLFWVLDRGGRLNADA